MSLEVSQPTRESDASLDPTEARLGGPDVARCDRTGAYGCDEQCHDRSSAPEGWSPSLSRAKTDDHRDVLNIPSFAEQDADDCFDRLVANFVKLLVDR
jgi:hypothetical protein